MGILLFVITLAATLLVQGWLKRTYSRWSKVENTSGLTGAQTARAILDANGLQNVAVEAVPGQLSDHYDPAKRVVRLSEDNYSRASVAGSAVAAHEVGHAIQHAKAYTPLQWRSALVPVAGIGSNFGPIIIVVGAMLGAAGLFQLGLMLFAAAVIFQLVTLPVEFDASRRALSQMEALGLATTGDVGGSRQVLNAAAMTYVAAAASSVAYLLYYLSMFMGGEE
jgi:Zn-dependent membrane protease YugP